MCFKQKRTQSLEGWQVERQKAFQSLKQVITETPGLAYYEPEKENLIQTDASVERIGCVLIQDGRLVCFASQWNRVKIQ